MKKIVWDSICLATIDHLLDQKPIPKQKLTVLMQMYCIFCQFFLSPCNMKPILGKSYETMVRNPYCLQIL